MLLFKYTEILALLSSLKFSIWGKKKGGWVICPDFSHFTLSFSTLPLIFLMTNMYFLHSPPSMLRREGRPWRNNFPILNGIIILSSTINQQKHNYSCKEEHYKCSVVHHCALLGYLTIFTKNEKYTYDIC